MRMHDVLKKKFLSVPVWLWGGMAVVAIVFYSIYCYSDVIWTTRNGLTLWYMIFERIPIGRFYVTPYPLADGDWHAYYDFFIYIIFAIWDFPLFIYEKLAETSFADNYIALWYAKSISLFFTFLSAYQVYKMTLKISGDREKAGWSVFSYIFSTLLMPTIVIMGGYDVISLFFTLCGINAYLEKKDKKFVVYFACAIACKMFALLVFVLLILLRWKKLWELMLLCLGGISFILIPKMYFILYQKICGVDTLMKGVDDTVSSVMYIDEYLWSGEAPLALAAIPLFFFFTFILGVMCYFCKKQLDNQMIVYILLLGMSVFILTSETHPYWIVLVAPYIAVLECLTWKNLSKKAFLEVCSGIGYILWKVRRSPLCFSYNVVINMLHIEEEDKEFWFAGIWTVINKLADITHIQIDHIWLLIRSVLVASFIMLLFYLMPKQNQEEKFPEEGEKYFYRKAFASIMVLIIPLLGVAVRFML